MNVKTRIVDILSGLANYLKNNQRMIFPFVGYFVIGITFVIGMFIGLPLYVVLWSILVGSVIAIYGYFVYPSLETS